MDTTTCLLQSETVDQVSSRAISTFDQVWELAVNLPSEDKEKLIKNLQQYIAKQGHTKAIILHILKEHETELKAKGVKSLALFGPVARDEITHHNLVNFLIELDRPFDFNLFTDVQFYLEDILHCPVKMGYPDDLRLEVRQQVLEEKIDAF
jgi:predicted nucleotidyltransferase